jgi:hypothetical protein
VVRIIRTPARLGVNSAPWAAGGCCGGAANARDRSPMPPHRSHHHLRRSPRSLHYSEAPWMIVGDWGGVIGLAFAACRILAAVGQQPTKTRSRKKNAGGSRRSAGAGAIASGCGGAAGRGRGRIRAWVGRCAGRCLAAVVDGRGLVSDWRGTAVRSCGWSRRAAGAGAGAGGRCRCPSAPIDLAAFGADGCSAVGEIELLDVEREDLRGACGGLVEHPPQRFLA